MSNYGAACPDCGSVRTLSATASLDPEGHRVRHRRCDYCGKSFTTVEVAVPFSFHRLDAMKHEYRNAKNPPRYMKDSLAVIRTDTSVKIRLIRGRPLDLCRKGLHELKGENVYVNPRSGARVCQPCRRETAKARYHHMMRHMPPSIRAERNARNAEYLRQRYAAGLRPRRKGEAA